LEKKKASKRVKNGMRKRLMPFFIAGNDENGASKKDGRKNPPEGYAQL